MRSRSFASLIWICRARASMFRMVPRSCCSWAAAGSRGGEGEDRAQEGEARTAGREFHQGSFGDAIVMRARAGWPRCREATAPAMLLLMLRCLICASFLLVGAAAAPAAAADALGLRVPGVLRVLASADEMPEVFSFDVRPAQAGFERELVEGFTRAHKLELRIVPVPQLRPDHPHAREGRGRPDRGHRGHGGPPAEDPVHLRNLPGAPPGGDAQAAGGRGRPRPSSGPSRWR